MLRIGEKSLKIFKRVRRSPFVTCSTRTYHSFPDPNEKPQISSAKSDVKKTLDKSLPDFNLKNSIKLDQDFPGVPHSSGIKKQKSPETLSTKLTNGVTVATQDTHGLMSSIAFLAHTGRLENCFASSK
jgi:alpha-acetolactate decarboxylase